ncbi:MAG: hypothetical protein M3O30_17895 [Planctomycetota bacterium]|nr:hypothetical protein [Planctomycetota bacterium]
MTILTATDKSPDKDPARSAVDLFHAVTQRTGVTYAESRVFDWLLRVYWPSVKPMAIGDGASSIPKLRARFVADSQLLVEWTGNPSNAGRRLVMVAHTDSEGYVLLNEYVVDGDDLLVAGISPTDMADREDVEKWRKGSPLAVMVGLDGLEAAPSAIVTGKVEAIAETPTGQEQFGGGRVVVRLQFQSVDDHKLVLAALAGPAGTVTAVHAFSQSTGRGVDIKDSGEVVAYGVDNAAGVAVATKVLTDLVLNGEGVNASVLYSTGEEAGFIGLLNWIAQDGRGLAEQAADWTWVVVDSSSQIRSGVRQLDQWVASASASQGAPTEAHAGERRESELCPMRCASVRLGDKKRYYEPATARMLYQAALEARREHQHAVEHGLSQHPNYQWIDGQWLGVCGVFKGGFCEASVLMCLDELIEVYAGGSPPDAVPVGQKPRARFGSIAIPIMNYRNEPQGAASDGNIELIPFPERTHLGALNSAVLILRQACRLHGDGYEVRRVNERITGYCHSWRAGEEQDQSTSFAKLIESHLEYYTLAQDYGVLSTLRHWVTSRGRELAAKIGDI